jgi:hypothetical protein
MISKAWRDETSAVAHRLAATWPVHWPIALARTCRSAAQNVAPTSNTTRPLRSSVGPTLPPGHSRSGTSTA